MAKEEVKETVAKEQVQHEVEAVAAAEKQAAKDAVAKEQAQSEEKETAGKEQVQFKTKAATTTDKQGHQEEKFWVITVQNQKILTEVQLLEPPEPETHHIVEAGAFEKKYELFMNKRLGSGQEGVVYVATERSSGRTIPPSYSCSHPADESALN